MLLRCASLLLLVAAVLPHGRLPLGLEAARVEAPTRARRALAWAALLAHCSLPVRDVLLAGDDARAIDGHLAAYGQYRYDHFDAGPAPFVDTIQGCTDVHRHLGHCLPRAWDVANAWRLVEPSQCRVPLPALGLRAMAALAFAWDWPELATALLLGFYAALRPGELLALRVGDVLTPDQLLHGLAHGFVVLRAPKTRKSVARYQHVRVDDGLLLRLLGALGQGRAPDAFLWPWPGSAETRARAFRRHWDALCAVLGFRDVLPSGLRAGAITWLYDAGMALIDIQWIGRWSTPQTLGSYIQELAAARVLAGLSATQRAQLARAGFAVRPLALSWLTRQRA